jgi:L-lactate utilization protein LutB
MCMQQKDYINVRVRKKTQRQLKIVAALRQESMLDTLTHLVQQEYDRLQQEGGKRYAADEKDQA